MMLMTKHWHLIDESTKDRSTALLVGLVCYIVVKGRGQNTERYEHGSC